MVDLEDMMLTEFTPKTRLNIMDRVERYQRACIARESCRNDQQACLIIYE